MSKHPISARFRGGGPGVTVVASGGMMLTGGFASAAGVGTLATPAGSSTPALPCSSS